MNKKIVIILLVLFLLVSTVAAQEDQEKKTIDYDDPASINANLATAVYSQINGWSTIDQGNIPAARIHEVPAESLNYNLIKSDPVKTKAMTSDQIANNFDNIDDLTKGFNDNNVQRAISNEYKVNIQLQGAANLKGGKLTSNVKGGDSVTLTGNNYRGGVLKVEMGGEITFIPGGQTVAIPPADSVKVNTAGKELTTTVSGKKVKVKGTLNFERGQTFVQVRERAAINGVIISPLANQINIYFDSSRHEDFQFVQLDATNNRAAIRGSNLVIKFTKDSTPKDVFVDGSNVHIVNGRNRYVFNGVKTFMPPVNLRAAVDMRMVNLRSPNHIITITSNRFSHTQGVQRQTYVQYENSLEKSRLKAFSLGEEVDIGFKKITYRSSIIPIGEENQVIKIANDLGETDTITELIGTGFGKLPKKINVIQQIIREENVPGAKKISKEELHRRLEKAGALSAMDTGTVMGISFLSQEQVKQKMFALKNKVAEIQKRDPDLFKNIQDISKSDADKFANQMNDYTKWRVRDSDPTLVATSQDLESENQQYEIVTSGFSASTKYALSSQAIVVDREKGTIEILYDNAEDDLENTEVYLQGSRRIYSQGGGNLLWAYMLAIVESEQPGKKSVK